MNIARKLLVNGLEFNQGTYIYLGVILVSEPISGGGWDFECFSKYDLHPSYQGKVRQPDKDLI